MYELTIDGRAEPGRVVNEVGGRPGFEVRANGGYSQKGGRSIIDGSRISELVNSESEQRALCLNTTSKDDVVIVIVKL